MEISGWGRYPRCQASVTDPLDEPAVLAQLAEAVDGEGLVARGLGRSYGDSALGQRVLRTRHLDRFISFDQQRGELCCEAGVSLGEVIDCCLPRGWFPPVVPGTRFVTVGGAVASDVHGKNHHRDGSFSAHVIGLRVATPSEGVLDCSPSLRPQLFWATCGGMGLTGVILSVCLRLRRVPSGYIDQTSWRAPNFRAALELFREHADAHYSVAWIDCSARGGALGRSVVYLGEHSDRGEQRPRLPRHLALPFDLPGALLNGLTIRAFNQAYFLRAGDRAQNHVSVDAFFFPLDRIHNWNRLYGRRGFLQYQLVLPYDAGEAGLETLLKRVSDSSHGAFLAVLKAFGEAGAGYLSFPRGGYTLAMDFRMAPGLLELLDELDRVVLDCGGRLYLAKDARMSGEMFRQGYPAWERFCAVRREYGAHRVFHSLQSKRLGI